MHTPMGNAYIMLLPTEKRQPQVYKKDYRK